jgi:hypothetical protein
LQDTIDYGLWYIKNIDADLEGSIDDRKRTSGGACFLGSCLASWLNKKQTSISLSTTKDKYIDATYFCTQVLWINTNLKEIQVPCNQLVSIMCDNTSAINLSKILFNTIK